MEPRRNVPDLSAVPGPIPIRASRPGFSALGGGMDLAGFKSQHNLVKVSPRRAWALHFLEATAATAVDLRGYVLTPDQDR